MIRRSLFATLLAWTLGAMSLLWLAFVLAGYLAGRHEADELTDGHLAGVATLLAGADAIAFGPEPGGSVTHFRPELEPHDYQRTLEVIIWRADGSLAARTAGSPDAPYPSQPGFATLSLGQPAQPWRSFARPSADGQRMVMALAAVIEQDELAHDITRQILEPGLWLLPLLALVVGLALWRGLRPILDLAREVNQLDVQDPAPLALGRRHREFEAPVRAINGLVARQQAAVLRERALADEFAHELRTPLTALALRVRALRDATGDPDARAMVEALEGELRRASDVVSHLLALARVRRASADTALEQVDLCALSRRVLGDCAQAALQTGQELAFSGPQAMHVPGHAPLLELALRNLVENAISHAPRGSLVEVRVLPDRLALQVCDGPAQGGEPADEAPREAGPSLGLGLGHQVVRKVAELHGARFARTDAPEGFTSCYELAFGSSPG